MFDGSYFRARTANWLNALQARRRIFRAALWATMPLIACGGCGERSATQYRPPQLHPIKGTVTYNGSPVAGATVTFSSGNTARSGQTDTQGHFMLRSSHDEGLPVGSYAVTVSNRPGYPPENAPPRPAPAVLLPAKYGSLVNSVLSANVTESGPNEFSFPLTD